MPIPVKYYFSTQTGAPECSAQLNVMHTFYDAILVNGFNEQSISTITVSNNIGTITTNANHGYNIDDIIVIEGANETDFNDEFYVKEVLSTTQFTIDIITIETVATGTLSCKIAPLGWEILHTDGNYLRVYRNNSNNPLSTSMVLHMDDSSSVYSTYMTMCEYIENTDLTTAINPLTTYWGKHYDASSTPRSWEIIGDDRIFYRFHDNYSNTYFNNFFEVFGDYDPIAYNPYACIIGGQTTNRNFDPDTNSYMVRMTISSLGQYAPRGYSRLGSKIDWSWYPFGYRTTYFQNALNFNRYTNSLTLLPVGIWDNTSSSFAGFSHFYTPLEEMSNTTAVQKVRTTIGGRDFMPFRVARGDNANYGYAFFPLNNWRQLSL